MSTALWAWGELVAEVAVLCDSTSMPILVLVFQLCLLRIFASQDKWPSHTKKELYLWAA